MGQIINRIKRIAKAYAINDADADSLRRAEQIIGSEDEELKRIIDELNSEKTHFRKSSNEATSNTYQNRNQNRNNRTNASWIGNLEYTKACSIIGVAIDATPNSIKAAYKRKIKEYHPDVFHNASEKARAEATQKTAEINKAYDLIKKTRNFA
jgi:DnaJ-domain-containing protein 1